MKSIIELNLKITKVGFFAVWSVGRLFPKKANILMVEQENLKRGND